MTKAEEAVIAGTAKQSGRTFAPLDCFGAAPLAMTAAEETVIANAAKQFSGAAHPAMTAAEETVIASVAKQSRRAFVVPDCFGATRLAMTAVFNG